MPILTNNIINNSGRNIYWLITFLFFSLGCSFGSTLAPEARTDSILYIFGSDTLKFKRVFSLSYPEYTPALDTSKNDVTAPHVLQPAESGLDLAGGRIAAPKRIGTPGPLNGLGVSIVVYPVVSARAKASKEPRT